MSVQTLDTEVTDVPEQVDEDDVLERVHFKIDEPRTFELGPVVDGIQATVDLEYFVGVAIEKETSEMERAMGSPDVARLSAVHASNEDGDIGSLFAMVRPDDLEEGEQPTVSDAIDAFEAEWGDE